MSPHGLRSGVVKALKAEEGEALFPSRLELTEGQVDRRQVATESHCGADMEPWHGYALAGQLGYGASDLGP